VDPVIREVENEFGECACVVRDSFITVAREFNITRENAPTNPAFAGADSLNKMKEKGLKLFGLYEGSACIGFVAIERANDGVFYMERLAVLPQYRHKGYGTILMDFVTEQVKKCGGKKISIGIINDNKVLKNWYNKYGFVETGLKSFQHLPFTVCFMEKEVMH
jgi:ribosomal protein S18 acetylase RimI-like enzyme